MILKIAIAGIGTVGKGLLKILESVEEGLLNKLEITAIASRRKLRLPKKKIYKNTIILNDANKILDFENYDILVELIGGESGVAKKIVLDALKKKKNVVTANKALISNNWKLINKTSKEKNNLILYEEQLLEAFQL